MTPKQLKKRLFYKEATPKVNRAAVKKYSRRDLNAVKRNEAHPNDEFESFFEFEEDLSELTPSKDQYESKDNNFIVMENIQQEVSKQSNNMANDLLHADTRNSSKEDRGISSSNIKPIILEDDEEGVGLEFCESLTSSGKKCKNKKTNGSIYCTMHKNKLINKIKKINNME